MATVSGPGILFVNSKIKKPDQLSEETFTKWYNDVHVPDVLNARPGEMRAAWRYECIDPEREAKYLAIYTMEDLAFGASEEFKNIPLHHSLFPGSGSSHDFIEFDSRFYKRTKVFETKSTKPGRAAIAIVAAMQPPEGGDEDLDNWYKQEHLQQVSEQPGWRRSTRYELARQAIGTGAPKYLAIHEFEEGTLPGGEKVVAFEPVSEWSERVMKEAKAIDAGKFKLVASFGEKDSVM
ncbi:hypothetical protein NA57DRAFT_54010 [Rhizodiscina lignyota]|uniref:Uncharacterized protein n=1 Tax=Rhizodiscina lignyota TaxID=1504668 RepID=A0A9P4IPC7_9PEZI|nr:hypothetical protein NA57DRAFT_54010 [Rhizodiscina lignyota]